MMFCAYITVKYKIDVIDNEINIFNDETNDTIDIVNMIVDEKNKDEKNIMDVENYVSDLTYRLYLI